MELNLAEKFLSLIHKPDKTGYRTDGQKRDIGLMGAILLDLTQENKIILVDGKIKALKFQTNVSPAHQEILTRIAQARKERKIKHWISRLLYKAGHYRKQVLVQMESKNILRVERRSFLFIDYLQTFVTDTQLQEMLKKQVRKDIFGNELLSQESAAMLGLVAACKLHKIVCNNREEIKDCKARIKTRIHNLEIPKEMEKVYAEMQAAMISTIIATTAATTAINASMN